MLKENFSRYLTESINKNWEYRALSDYQGETYHYHDVAGHIVRIHQFFRDSGIRPGDRIALIGKNSARWGILYITTVTYGAVIVPVLPDFKPDDMHQIVDHSDAFLLFAEDAIYEKLDPEKMPQVGCVISISSLSLLKSSEQIRFAFKKNDLSKLTHSFYKDGPKLDLPEIPGDHLAVLSYTSGTTGFTKGVMLPHNSLAANMKFAHHHMPLNPGDRIVSFLPLAHTFGAAFEFLFPFTLGCDITILTKTPSPQVIIKAFQEVRPSLILSVPLVIEKIYKKQVLPAISKPIMRVLLVIPGIRSIILKKIKEKLTAVFGGNFRELVIGGAAFNAEAEAFFRKMRFPFTVGYGMTECGPLISYVGWKESRMGSAGKTVDTLELKIDSSDPEKKSGEIMVRGDNVMLGYYKNEKATTEVLDEDGWLHTGDLGRQDRDGHIYIRGRIKSVLIGSNGKNIYPEEIESHFNNKFLVAESVVVQRNDKLVALICPDHEEMEKAGMKEEELAALFEHHRKTVNHHLPGFMNVSKVEIHAKEFQKTPKRSIKRFLYS
ncbi:MAG: AMP-binding protein [Bacteroidales bacterium]|jgi:long-chain acyl-CoA synthetase|nr:AMP-binding protein [Bacteroidales bacterium]